MENSPLRFLKDYDIIIILNNLVPKSKQEMAKKYHMDLYYNRLFNNNYFSKLHVDNTFWKINEKRNLSKYVSIIQPEYPFYNNLITKKLDVKHAIRIYEKYKKPSGGGIFSSVYGRCCFILLFSNILRLATRNFKTANHRPGEVNHESQGDPCGPGTVFGGQGCI